MANEIKIAKAAREIAAELAALPSEAEYPFGDGHVFRVDGGHKAPCCAIGHGRENHRKQLSFRSSTAAIEDTCCIPSLPADIEEAIGDVVEANDYLFSAQRVSKGLYDLANELELAAAPTTDTQE